MSIKQKMKESRMFAKSWAKNPLRLGALFQTSQTFARKVCSQVDWSGDCVLELGAGLGNITSELIKHKPQNTNFACVEMEESFCMHLNDKFPDTNVVQGDAAKLEELFPEYIGKVRTIVSLIPMVSLPPKIRKQILASCMKMLDKGGFLLQGSYYWKPITKQPGTAVKRINFVWQNLPPIHLYKYTNLK